MGTPITTTGQLAPLLQRLRKNQGLSQAGLGQKLGLSQERISRIERFPEKVTFDQLLTVLMALDAELQVAPRHTLSGKAAVTSTASGKLSGALGTPPLDPAHDRVMICGSPGLLRDLKAMLLERRFVEGNTTTPADFVVERAFVDQ